MKMPDLRVFAYGAIIAPFVFAAMWIASALTDGSWIFGEQTLSTLGVSSNALSAGLFNAACIISGIFGLVFGIGRYHYDRGLNRYGGLALCIGMIFLIFVGVFTKAPETLTVHTFVACTFGLFAVIAMILSAIEERNHIWLSVTTVILLIFCTIMIATQEKAMWEAWSIISVMVWLFIQGVKYTVYRDEFISESKD